MVSVMVSERHTGIMFSLETVKLLGKFRNQLPLEPIWWGMTFDTEPGHNCTVLHWFLPFCASQTTLFFVRSTVANNFDLL
jgi:hypothetical protein